MNQLFARSRSPLALLIGAHDRHNLGDLLLGQIAAALLPHRPIAPAGVVARDLTACGGFAVSSLADLASRHAQNPVDLIHFGGEILTTTAWQAAVMVAETAAVPELIARYDRHPHAARAYAAATFGFAAEVPYLVSRTLFPHARRIVGLALGGVDLLDAEAALRQEVVAKLAEMTHLTVRDRVTQAALAANGMVAALAPDLAVLTAALFGRRIAAEVHRGEVALCRRLFPQGFLAVQFAASCSDDATLAALAQELQRISAASGCAIVFFRAGAAPWHDDLEAYQRCAALLRQPSHCFATLYLWQIAALIAASKGFLGTSLHGRIVAAAFAKPRLNFWCAAAQDSAAKVAAYCATWEPMLHPAVVPLSHLAKGWQKVLAYGQVAHRTLAQSLTRRARQMVQQLLAF